MKVRIIASLLLAYIMVIGGTALVSGAEVDIADTVLEASVENNLKITADHVNVNVQLSNSEDYSFDYDSSKFTITTYRNGVNFEIEVTAKTGAAIGWDDGVTVYIPDQPYTTLSGISKKGGLSLPAVNANITVTNNEGAVSVTLPENYSKSVSYTGKSGSGSLHINGNSNFSINGQFSNSAISIPGDWPAYSNGKTSYSYTSDSGLAYININLKNCSFSFRQ